MRSARYSSTKTAVASSTNTNTPARAKHDALTSYSDPSVVPPASRGTGLSHATAMSAQEGSYLSLRPIDHCTNTSNLTSRPYGSLHSALPASNLSNITSAGQQHTRARIVQEMELAEVDELLQEMEATELAKRINNVSEYQPIQQIALTQTADNPDSQERESLRKLSGTNRRLDFQSCDKEAQLTDILSTIAQKKPNNAFPDISLPYSDSFHLNETDKMISEFKTWERNVQQPAPKSNGYTNDSVNSIKNIDHLSNVSSAAIGNVKPKEAVAEQNVSCISEASSINRILAQAKSSNMNTDSMSHNNELIKLIGVTPSEAMQHDNTEHLLDLYKMPQYADGSLHDDKERSECSKSTVHVGTNTDLHLRYILCS